MGVVQSGLGNNRLELNLKMKLAILGATGRTGLEAVKQALADNHTVTAVVRNPAKITLAHDNLKVVRPAGLTDGNATEGEFKVAEGEYAVAGAAGRIARADVARFMLSILEQEKYYKKQLAIAV